MKKIDIDHVAKIQDPKLTDPAQVNKHTAWAQRSADPAYLKKMGQAVSDAVKGTRSGKNNSFFGKKHDEETRKRQGVKPPGYKNWLSGTKGQGLITSPMKGLKGADNPLTGRKRPEHSERMRGPRNPNAGPSVQMRCPHCDKQGGGGVMKRWHFDNCGQR